MISRRKLLVSTALVLPVVALDGCAPVATVVADAQAVVSDVNGVGVAILNAVPVSAGQAIKDAVKAAIAALGVSGATPAAIVLALASLAGLVAGYIPDFVVAVTNATSVVGLQWKQLQTDVAKLKTDLGISTVQTLDEMRGAAMTLKR